MRKSKSRSTARMATAAGLTTGAVTAALLVAPTAAFAATTVTPPVVAPGGVATITDTDSSPFTAGTGATASRVQLLTTGTTCVTPMPAASASVLAADITTAPNVAESTTTTVTFRLPATATAGTNGQAKRYLACVYNPTGGTAREGLAAGYPVWVGTPPTLTTTIGPSGGGNTVGVTTSTPIFTGVTTVGAQFTTANDCPTTYATPTANLAGTVTRVGDASVNVAVPAGVASATTGTLRFLMCLYNGTATTSALISAARYTVSHVLLSQYTGPWQGLNALNITGATPLFAGIDTVGVAFQQTACETTYEETGGATLKPVTQANVRRISDERVALTIPALHSSAPTAATEWLSCLYNGAVDESSPLIASVAYTATTVHTATGITPSAGPALGGSRIVVSGTALPLTPGEITATLGGTPLTNITPISATAFSAITPAHAPANNVALVVSTSSGQHTLANAYSYTAALKVTPNTAPNTRPVSVIVRGVGFQSAAFPTDGDLVAGAHFYLVEGTYSGADSGGDRANAPVTDCANVLVLSDTEGICTLNLHRRLDLEGDAEVAQYTPPVAAANDVTTVLGSRIITAIADEFTELHVGQIIAETGNTNIPAGTRIVNVLGPRTAVISTPAVGTDADGFTMAYQVPIYRTNVSITTTGTNTIAAVTAPDGTFSQADVGKVIVGHTNITDGTRILSVQSSTAATLSANAATAGTDTATMHLQYNPVPEGAYNLTFVSNGAVGAVSSDPNYVQSLVSSGSTFTVSSF
uniref:IPT/TIG domain-containing protein n=1 Tax=Paractinoplanes polyasparticus TaxID=2856853 RepID=UPI001C8438C3|nr:IPT/TIG domain-containing protein [Actinoplanes polyasparticus]